MGDGEIDPSTMDLQTLGLGAIRHMQEQSGGGGAGGVNHGPGVAGGMFGNIFDGADGEAGLAEMSRMFAQQANISQTPGGQTNLGGILQFTRPADIMPTVVNGLARPQGTQRTQGSTPTVPTGTVGTGFDRLFSQYATQPSSTQSIWGPAQPPLYGNHAVFTTPINGSASAPINITAPKTQPGKKAQAPTQLPQQPRK